MRTPTRPRLSVVALLAGAALTLASCGGGSDEDVQELLNKAFRADIKSAELDLDARVQVEGSGAIDRPLRIEASGPFRSNEDKLPSVDLELKIGTGAQAVRTGFVSTGDRAFVEFQDVFYEQSRSEVERANEAIRRNSGERTSLGSLGLDPRSWLKEAEEKGTEDVAGVETTHVSGRLDVASLVRDLNQFVRRSRGAIGGATGQPAPRELSKRDIDRITEVVKDPTFDVYVGKDDDVIRRISGRVELGSPADAGGALGGVEGGSLEFSIEFSDVNGDQRIEAPKKARPISELMDSLGPGFGGLGGRREGLGGQDGAGGEQDGGAPTAPPSGAGPTPESFKRYAECLDRAPPEDTDALQRCAELLQ